MLRTAKIVLSATFLALAATASGCSSEPQEEVTETCQDITVDPPVRVADEECESQDVDLKKKRARVYSGAGDPVPAVGRPYSRGSFSLSKPAGTTTVKTGVLGRAGISGGSTGG